MSSTPQGRAWGVASNSDVAATPHTARSGAHPGSLFAPHAQRHATADDFHPQKPRRIASRGRAIDCNARESSCRQEITTFTSSSAGPPRSYAAALRGKGASTSTGMGQAAGFRPAASVEPPSAATPPATDPAAVDAAALSPSASPARSMADPAALGSPHDMASGSTNPDRHAFKATATQLAHEQQQGQEQEQQQQQQPGPAGADIPVPDVPAGTGEGGEGDGRGCIAPEEDMHLLTRALDAGCSLLQSTGPVKKIHQHVCAFHMWVGVGAGGRGWGAGQCAQQGWGWGVARCGVRVMSACLWCDTSIGQYGPLRLYRLLISVL